MRTEFHSYLCGSSHNRFRKSYYQRGNWKQLWHGRHVVITSKDRCTFLQSVLPHGLHDFTTLPKGSLVSLPQRSATQRLGITWSQNVLIVCEVIRAVFCVVPSCRFRWSVGRREIPQCRHLQRALEAVSKLQTAWCCCIVWRGVRASCNERLEGVGECRNWKQQC